MPDMELCDQTDALFAHAKHQGGFGLVLLEAITCGVPAIGGEADGSVDPLSCFPLGIAARPEQVADAIVGTLETPPREREPNALADRFGRAVVAGQLAAVTAAMRVG